MGSSWAIFGFWVLKKRFPRENGTVTVVIKFLWASLSGAQRQNLRPNIFKGDRHSAWAFYFQILESIRDLVSLSCIAWFDMRNILKIRTTIIWYETLYIYINVYIWLFGGLQRHPRPLLWGIHGINYSALAARFPHIDHVCNTTERLVCFHKNEFKNEFEDMRCKLNFTENLRL